MNALFDQTLDYSVVYFFDKFLLLRWWMISNLYYSWHFRHLRELFQVDPADYMLAICGNDALRELSSPGKSGSYFYLTQDDRFIIKTVKKSEVKVCSLL